MDALDKKIDERLTDDLYWRYATKKFDTNKSLSEEHLEALLNSVRLSASSYGLQPYHIVVAKDADLREKMRPACWDQAQITDSSCVLVFTHRTDFDGSLVDSYLEHVARERDMSMDDLKGYGDFMKSKLLEMPREKKAAWTARQAYIAIGNLLHTAARLRVDACPMEGFEPAKLNDILDLESKGLSAVALVALGYRSEDDATQHQAKVRRPETELFTRR